MWLTVERGLAANSLAAYRRDLRRYEQFLARPRDRRSARGGGVDGRRPTSSISAGSGSRTAKRTSRRRRSRVVSSRCGRSTGSARRKACSKPTRASRWARRACRKESRRPSTSRRSTGSSSRSPATHRGRNAIAPSSRCSTRPACGSASWSGSTSPMSISTTASPGCSARATRSGWCRWGAPLAPSSAATAPTAGSRCDSPRGRRRDADAVFLNVRGGRLTRQGCWQIVRRARGARRSRRAALAARAAPLVRHAHARSRRRHPRRAGAVGALERVDDAGVHEGLSGAAASRLRVGAPPREERLNR